MDASIILVVSTVLFINSEETTRSILMDYELNGATMEYCEKNIAPYFEKELDTGEKGMTVFLEAKCFSNKPTGRNVNMYLTN